MSAEGDSAEDPVEVINTLLDRISALDTAGVAALFDENLRFEHMFMPDGVPLITTSGAELARSMVDTLSRFEKWHIWMTNAYRLEDDPSMAISEWESEGLLKSGQEYRNTYIGIHRVANGRIVFWREYAHPNPMELVWTENHRPDI